MISDTLFDSATRIREYLENHAEIYAPHRERIERVLGEMDGLRRELDTPPFLAKGPGRD